MSFKTIKETEYLITIFEHLAKHAETEGDDWGHFINLQQLEDCQMWLKLLKERE